MQRKVSETVFVCCVAEPMRRHYVGVVLVATILLFSACASVRKVTYVYSGGFTGHSLTLHSDRTFEFSFSSDDGSFWQANGTWKCIDAKCTEFETVVEAATPSPSPVRLMPPMEQVQRWRVSRGVIYAVAAKDHPFRRIRR